jgi:purine nucleoside permease
MGRERGSFGFIRPSFARQGFKSMVSRSSFLLAAALLVAVAQRVAADEPPLAPKVLVITMFAGEAEPWLDGASFQRKIAVAGLTKAFPKVACSTEGLCRRQPAWATPMRRV